MAVIRVDEHYRRHPRGGQHLERYVTVVIDPTPVRNDTGPTRLLELVEGRSKACSPAGSQTAAFRDGLQVVAMDGFTGFKTATAEALPDAVEVTCAVHQRIVAAHVLHLARTGPWTQILLNGLNRLRALAAPG